MNLIETAMEYVEALFAANAGGHDAAHMIRVYENTMLLAETEPGGDPEVMALAALLHDVDDHKLFATRDNRNARSFMEQHGISSEKTEAVIDVINSVSFSQNRGKRPATLEGRIVQDADRLDAIGAVGIARTFAYGGKHGRPLEASIQHFHEKLLLLRNEMNTDSAKGIAEQRHAFMLAFLQEFAAETGGSPDNPGLGEEADGLD